MKANPAHLLLPVSDVCESCNASVQDVCSLPCAAAGLDPDARIVHSNAAFRRLFPSVLKGMAVEHLLADWLGPDATSALALWRQSAATVRPLVLEGADGRHLALQRGSGVLLVHELTEDRQRERALLMSNRHLQAAVCERTRELEQARLHAERAQYSKTRFFAAASHDLLQPLNAARIYAAALADIPGLDPVAADVSRRIDLALRNAEDIVDTLVDVARFDASRVEAQVEAIDLDRLLEPLVDQYGSVARQRGLRLRWRPSGRWVRTDPRLLRRVVQNLLANALRYTACGGVLVGVRRHGLQARIEVWDTGPGIAPAEQALIFEEFERLASHSPWGERGLGLGLWICRRIAALLDHGLDLRSVPGRGSVFSISLPMVAAEPVDLGVLRPVGPVQGSQSRPLALVLVADDAVRSALLRLWSGWGLEVLGAPDPRGTAGLLGGRTPKFLLVDEDVPDGLGFAMDRRAVPVRLYCSGDRGEGLARRLRESGVLGLGKPLKPARLRAIVEDAMRVSPMRD